MSKHTPGPWAFTKNSEFSFSIRVSGDGAGLPITSEYDPEIAVAHNNTHYEHTDGRQEANARLIAAAPELLAALKAIHNHRPLGEGSSEYSLAVESIARAAIAKATGEQS